LRFLTEAIGSPQIEVASRVIGFKGAVEDEHILTIEQIMDELGNDLNWWERYFSSMSNNPDIWG